MKNMTIQTIVMIILVFTTFIGCSSNNSDIHKLRQDSITKIDDISSHAKIHNDALKQMKQIASKSAYNLDLIVQISDYISKVPYETLTLISIAKIASQANQECPKLYEVVELTVLEVGKSSEIVNLAKRCTSIKDSTDIKEIDNKIDLLRSTAKYKNVEAALRAI